MVGGRLAEAKALIHGTYSQLLQDPPHAVEDGGGVQRWWGLAGHYTAGTVEIPKNIIAPQGLGLPR